MVLELKEIRAFFGSVPFRVKVFESFFSVLGYGFLIISVRFRFVPFRVTVFKSFRFGSVRFQVPVFKSARIRLLWFGSVRFCPVPGYSFQIISLRSLFRITILK